MKFLLNKAAAEPAAYEAWYRAMGIYLKEGACSEEDPKLRADLVKLLRYESTALPPGTLTTFESLLQRRAEAGNGGGGGGSPAPVHYLVAPSREAAEGSPYLEAFRAAPGRPAEEVLLLYSAADEIVMKGLGDVQGAWLVNAEQGGPEGAAAGKEEAAAADGGGGGGLSEQQVARLAAWLEGDVLKGRVRAVRPSKRLVDSPAVLTGHMTETMRQMLRAQSQMQRGGGEAAGPEMPGLDGTGAVLELNPKHELVVALAAAEAGGDGERRKLAAVVAEQLLDNARLAAGALDDTRSMVVRLNGLLQAALLQGKGADGGGANERRKDLSNAE